MTNTYRRNYFNLPDFTTLKLYKHWMPSMMQYVLQQCYSQPETLQQTTYVHNDI